MREVAIYSFDEFESESKYLDTLVWEALAIEAGMSVLFCGYGPDGTMISHAIDVGAEVHVIDHRDDEIRKYAHLNARLIRGSTSVIPARNERYDMAIAAHYLHEADPFFHGQILSELGRVAKRIGIIELAPPADPVGRKIASLYSQAKRELGQFEYYQPLEYWKKLLQGVRAAIDQHVFAFAKVPPREYVTDTIELLIATMQVEEAPQSYLDELRALAKRPDATLLPAARFVLVGAPAGELPIPNFTPRKETSVVAAPAIPALTATQKTPNAPVDSSTNFREQFQREVSADMGYEFPPLDEAPPPLEQGKPQPGWSRKGQQVPQTPQVPPTPPKKKPFKAPTPEQPAVPPVSSAFGVGQGSTGKGDAFGVPPPANNPPFGWPPEPPEYPENPPFGFGP